KRHLIPLTQPGGTLAPGERAVMQNSALAGRRVSPRTPNKTISSKARRPTSVPRHPLSLRKSG
ncbi:MAG: hypothetical protein IV084_11015, partial [Rugosibacter sp.]|nr:hypothetical protein [Rugosibacter sp.]